MYTWLLPTFVALEKTGAGPGQSMLDGDGIIGVVSRGIRLATASQCETRERGSSALTRTHAVSVCLSVCLSLPYPNCTGPSCPVCRECWAVLQPDKREVKGLYAWHRRWSIWTFVTCQPNVIWETGLDIIGLYGRQRNINNINNINNNNKQQTIPRVVLSR